MCFYHHRSWGRGLGSRKVSLKLESTASVVLEELSLKKNNNNNLMLRWQQNKMATGHKTDKLCRQSSNDHNCQIWFASLVMEKMQFNHFPIISLWHDNQTKRQITIILAILNCPYPNNIFT